MTTKDDESKKHPEPHSSEQELIKKVPDVKNPGATAVVSNAKQEVGPHET